MTQANTKSSKGVKITDGQADVDFTILRDRYMLIATATWGGGSIALKALAADGTTYVAVKDVNGNAVSLTADGSALVDLPAGSYRLDFTTANAAYVTLTPAGSPAH